MIILRKLYRKSEEEHTNSEGRSELDKGTQDGFLGGEDITTIIHDPLCETEAKSSDESI